MYKQTCNIECYNLRDTLELIGCDEDKAIDAVVSWCKNKGILFPYFRQVEDVLDWNGIEYDNDMLNNDFIIFYDHEIEVKKLYGTPIDIGHGNTSRFDEIEKYLNSSSPYKEQFRELVSKFGYEYVKEAMNEHLENNVQNSLDYMKECNADDLDELLCLTENFEDYLDQKEL